MKYPDIIETMKALESRYNEWEDDKIEKQIDEILSCGYEWKWNGERGGFKHSVSGLYLNIPGLNFYQPEDIRPTYERTWSTSVDYVKKKESFVKFLQAIALAIISLVCFAFLQKLHATIVVGFLFFRALYYYLTYKNQKR